MLAASGFASGRQRKGFSLEFVLAVGGGGGGGGGGGLRGSGIPADRVLAAELGTELVLDEPCAPRREVGAESVAVEAWRIICRHGHTVFQEGSND